MRADILVLKLPKLSPKNRKEPNDILVIHAQVEPKYISYLNGIFEGYEWVAVIRTIDPAQGIMEFLSSSDLENDLRGILEGLKDEVGLRILD